MWRLHVLSLLALLSLAAAALDVPMDAKDYTSTDCADCSPLTFDNFFTKQMYGDFYADSGIINGTKVDMVNCITLRHKPGSISGRAACNNFWADTVTDGDAPTAIGPITVTKMKCDDALMELQHAFLQSLKDGFTFFGSPPMSSSLRIVGPNSVWDFARKPKSFGKCLPLYGPLALGDWYAHSATTVNGAKVDISRCITLHHDVEDSQFHGQSACNHYFTQVTMDPYLVGSISSNGPVASTRMGCGSSVMALEDAFYDLLQEMTSFELNPLRSKLTISSPTSVWEFRRKRTYTADGCPRGFPPKTYKQPYDNDLVLPGGPKKKIKRRPLRRPNQFLRNKTKRPSQLLRKRTKRPSQLLRGQH